MRSPGLLDPVAVLELEQLAAAYWALADGDTEQAIAELFVEDARLELGSLTLSGRAGIETFFAHRAAAQRSAQRTTRHIACNQRYTALDPSRVRVRSTVLVYAGVGEVPLPSAAPSGIADFDDVCVRTPEGWRYAERVARTVFIGPGAASFAR